MYRSLILVSMAFAWVAPLLGADSDAKPDSAKGIEFFEQKIRPVLVANCYQCHSASAKELKGKLRLDTREGIRKGGEQGPAVVPNKVAASLIVAALKHEEGLEMPPKQKLSDEIVADFTKWIELGAPDPRRPNSSTVGSKINIVEARQWWSFQPPKLSPAPATASAAGTTTTAGPPRC